MALGNTEAILKQSKVIREGEQVVSERTFNLIIGGMLLWGFLLNFLTVSLFGEQVLRLVYGVNPFVFLIGYIVLVLAGNALVMRGSTALSFIGYTLIAAPIGMVICLSVQGIPVSTVKSAVLITAIVTLSFMIAATVFTGFFLSLGRVLFFSLLFTIVGGLISTLLFRGRGFVLYEWLSAGIFSLYIGYDWARANTCAPTVHNAVCLSASLYLDIVNLFLRILSILNRNDRK